MMENPVKTITFSCYYWKRRGAYVSHLRLGFQSRLSSYRVMAGSGCLMLQVLTSCFGGSTYHLTANTEAASSDLVPVTVSHTSMPPLEGG